MILGTNDMNPSVATEPMDQAPQRLGALIDQTIAQCPDATILVAQIINAADPTQEANTMTYDDAVPGIVQTRAAAGHHVLTVDFRSITAADLIDGVHPNAEGYAKMGNIWAAALQTIPEGWLQAPVGPDPNRTAASANGGQDESIPAPNYGVSPVQVTSPNQVVNAAAAAAVGGRKTCPGLPKFDPAGEIAPGLGQNGAWKYTQNWVSAGEVSAGLGLNSSWVRLADMDGDGKADYLWVDPSTGALTCWLNKLPGAFVSAGSNSGIIASGAGVGESIFFADMNGDGLSDYLIVNPNNGEVTAWSVNFPKFHSAAPLEHMHAVVDYTLICFYGSTEMCNQG